MTKEKQKAQGRDTRDKRYVLVREDIETPLKQEVGVTVRKPEYTHGVVAQPGGDNNTSRLAGPSILPHE